MNTLSEETPEDGKQRRKSIGIPGSPFVDSGGRSKLGGGKIRRYSIGITSSRKSIGEEGKNIIPNYLRASTGSCHDFCKYGKKHEHSKSSVPVKFKRSTVVNKEKVTRTVVPVERKKTTMVTKLKPLTDPKARTPVKSMEVTKQRLSTNGKAIENGVKGIQRSTLNLKPIGTAVNSPAGLNGGIKKKDVKTVKKLGMMPKVIKKAVVEGTPTESQLKAVKNRTVKQVAPLKDQNRMKKTEPKKTSGDKVKIKALQGAEVESKAKPETMDYEIMQSMKLINTECSLGRDVVEKELMIPDKELLEESSIATPVVKSSQSSSDKEVLEEDSIIPPLVSESSQSFYDEDVLEDDFEYTDDDEVEDAVVSANNDEDEIETFVGNDGKILRKGRMVISEDKDDEMVKLRFRRGKILDLKSENNGPRRLKFRRRVKERNESKFGRENVVLKHQGEQEKKDAQGLFNNVIEETASKLVESRKSKVKALVGAFETVISLQDGKPSST